MTAFLLASITLNLGGNKPFNPIIGETFQIKEGDISAYYEQTAHHPPILNYYIKSPLFIGYGYSQVDVVTGTNSMTFEDKGKLYVKFNDGVVFLMKPPKFQITGLMLGRRYITLLENMFVEDLVT